MPTRALRFQGLNPYRNLQNRDPALNGMAMLGAALMNAPATRAAAQKEAFNEEMKIQDGLFEREHKTGRAKADDHFKSRTLDQSGERDRRTDEYRGAVLKDRGADRTFRGEQGDKNRQVQSDGQYMRGENDFVRQQEQGRHNRTMEEIAQEKGKSTAPQKKEAALIASDIWNKARQASYKVVDVAGYPTKTYDPIAHQQNYNQLRKLAGREDVPEWMDVQGVADKMMSEGAGEQQAPPPERTPHAAPTPDRMIRPPSMRSGAPTLFDDVPSAPGADANTRELQTATPGLFGDQAPTGGGMGSGRVLGLARNVATTSLNTLKTMHPDDQAAFKRILASGDQKRIAAAMERLQQLDGGAGADNEESDDLMMEDGTDADPDDLED